MDTENVIQDKSIAEKKPSKKKGSFGVVRWIILAVCFGIIALSGYKLWQKYSSYKENKDAYADITAIATAPSSYNFKDDSQSGESTNPIPEWLVTPIPEVDFAALKEIGGDDAFGWLYIPDTVMNYPVARTDNNDYYLNHVLGGRYNSGGCPFLDYRNAIDLSDKHSQIYGHHLRNGMMFACLDEYADQEFYEEHKTVYMTTENARYKLYVLSAYVTSSVSDSYKRTFIDDEDYEAWLDEIRSLSSIQSDVELTAEDRVMTLSTCAYTFKNARFVVHCKLVKCIGDSWYDEE